MPQSKIQAWIERIPRHIQCIIECEGDNTYKEGRTGEDSRKGKWAGFRKKGTLSKRVDMGNDKGIREIDSGIEKVEERPKKRNKRNKQDGQDQGLSEANATQQNKKAPRTAAERVAMIAQNLERLSKRLASAKKGAIDLTVEEPSAASGSKRRRRSGILGLDKVAIRPKAITAGRQRDQVVVRNSREVQSRKEVRTRSGRAVKAKARWECM
jgi:hypothetical protein